MDTRLDNRETGRLGEEIATAFLTARGYRILERNFRCKGGEVDIVARAPGSGCLVFAEVKARRGVQFGLPQQAVTPFKQRQLSKAALTWLAQNRQQGRDARFDVVAVLLSPDGNHRVEQIENAFELAY
ncbi:YraN family protein [Trichlorobacter ammonificans]|nr:YraN family protein [Trichlorobacter ammonificans]